MKKVLLISGSLPPIRCGIGYYTIKLIKELSVQGLDFEVLSTEGVDKDIPTKLWTVPNWKVWSLPKMLGAINKSGAEIIHIQYPAVGYRRQLGINLLPYWLRIFKPHLKVIVTLHEYHDSRWLGRCRDVITALPAHQIIVSNQADRLSLPTWLVRKSMIVPIGSNLEKVPKNPKIYEDILRHCGLDAQKPTILFFGFAYPAKGLESLLSAMSRPYLSDWQLLLLTDLDKNNGYHRSLLSQVEELNKATKRVGVAGFLPDEQVSVILQEGRYFVLPQSMPITAKSGTAIAAVQHGLILISCGGQPKLSLPFKHLENCFLPTNINAGTLVEAIKHLESSPDDRRAIINGAKNLEKYFSWLHIGDEHIRIYEEA